METINLYNKFDKEWKDIWIKNILDNLDENLDFEALSYNPNLTWEMVKAYPKLDWSFKYL